MTCNLRHPMSLHHPVCPMCISAAKHRHCQKMTRSYIQKAFCAPQRVVSCVWMSIVNTLQHTATHCNTLQHTATYCNTLQLTATHCNVSCRAYEWVMSHRYISIYIWRNHIRLQLTAIHCNTLQPTARHCNVSCRAYEWVMSHIYISIYIWRSHIRLQLTATH